MFVNKGNKTELVFIIGPHTDGIPPLSRQRKSSVWKTYTYRWKL